MDVTGLIPLETAGYAGLALFGMAVGIIGSMIGLGGGVIIVPVLSALGLPPTMVASSSISAVLSNAVASTASYARQRRIAYKTGMALGLLSVPGAVLGSFVTELAAPDEFHAAFAVVLAGSGAYVLLKPLLSRGSGREPGRMSMILAGAISFAVGIMSGLFGIGGGIVFMPLLIIVLGMDIKRAAPTSQMMLLFSSSAGVAAHYALGHADPGPALYLAAGAFAGGMIGARVSRRVGEGPLRWAVAAAVLGGAAAMILL